MSNPYIKTLKPVWRNLNHISINKEKLRELITVMRQKKEAGKLIAPAWAEPNMEPPIDCSLEEWINFICWTNSINFAFTNFAPPHNKFTIEHPRGIFWKGANAMEASFVRAQEEGTPIFDARYMAEISFTDFKSCFRPINSSYRLPMLRERWQIIHEVAKVLLKKYNGSWLEFFKKCSWLAFNSGKGIAEQLIANFPSFRDERVQIVREERVLKRYDLAFHKRAQLLVMVYNGRALQSDGKFPLIRDAGDIGPICDYEVPKALEVAGVLEYSSEMKSLIQKHHIFPPGHSMETENRLATAYVMDKICSSAGITMAQADYYFWEMGRKSKEPHILVPTTDY